MSAENVAKRCSDCTLGKKVGGGKLNLPVKSAIPLGILVPPKIRRICLSRFENIKDSFVSKIEDTIDRDIPIERAERIVTFSSKCVKPDSYSPRE